MTSTATQEERQLRVLLSAYACEPGKGSEPGVGWDWATQMARFHDITVITRTNNRSRIETALAAMRNEINPPRFIYHDLPDWILRLKRFLRIHRIYYVLWQKSANAVIAELVKQEQFDLLHHVTFASFRYPTAIKGHGVPTLWGPVGGVEAIPWRLLPWRFFRHLPHEISRNLANTYQIATTRENSIAGYGRILASTKETERFLISKGRAVRLFPTIGIRPVEPATTVFIKGGRGGAPLRVLYVGNILYLKGVHLAIKAFAKAQSHCVLTIVGDGNFLAVCRSLAIRLGVEDMIRFLGKLPHDEVLQQYPVHDVFIFPSLHDSGGIAALEAMSYGLPVIALNCGGPAIMVQEECGVAVAVTTESDIVENLKKALDGYAKDPEKLHRHGANALSRVMSEYSWPHKAQQMDLIYREAVAGPSPRHAKKLKEIKNSIGSSTKP